LYLPRALHVYFFTFLKEGKEEEKRQGEERREVKAAAVTETLWTPMSKIFTIWLYRKSPQTPVLKYLKNAFNFAQEKSICVNLY
jgi:hypothetical protein